MNKYPALRRPEYYDYPDKFQWVDILLLLILLVGGAGSLVCINFYATESTTKECICE